MRRIIIILMIFLPVFGLDRNPYFSSEEELERWFWDSTRRGVEERLLFELVDTTGGKAVWKVETRCFCRLDWSVYVLYDWNNDSIICGHGLIAGIDFGEEGEEEECEEECNTINLTEDQKRRTKLIIRYLLQKEINELLRKDFSDEREKYEKFKVGKIPKYEPFLAPYVVELRYWRYVPIDSTNVGYYNDLGYFLCEGGRYREAIVLLEEVVRAVPTRTVAYLNLGDAYWGIGDTIKARENYCKYIELMKAEKKEKRIPSHVKERCLQKK